MGLNIKNEETHRLIRELAELTGETQTAAVTEAVRERLERLKVNPRAGVGERLMAIARETAPLFGPYDPSEDPSDFLYDENGLPK